MTTPGTSLYEELDRADDDYRLDVAYELFEGMRHADDPEANDHFYDLSEEILRRQGVPFALELSQNGVYAPYNAAALVRQRPRVSGFLQAIERAPEVDSAIDAGTGPAALLAIALALYHDKAYVRAYEAEPRAARAATEMVRLMGLSKRIKVTELDVLDPSRTLPRVGLAVTETFGAGLWNERGPEITEALDAVAEEVLPSEARVHVANTEGPATLWLPSAVIDLKHPGTVVSGSFESTVAGDDVPVMLYTGLYDARGAAVLAEPNVDDITTPRKIGQLTIPTVGDVIAYTYGFGVDSPEARTSVGLVTA